MSSISISVKKPIENIKLVGEIKKITGISPEYIKKRLLEEKEGIFFTAELFLNDHKKIEKKIRGLLKVLDKAKAEVFIMEIKEDESWEDVKVFDDYEISKEELLTLLDENNENFA